MDGIDKFRSAGEEHVLPRLRRRRAHQIRLAMSSECRCAAGGQVGQDIQIVLDDTGIQQAILYPLLALVGPLGGLFTG